MEIDEPLKNREQVNATVPEFSIFGRQVGIGAGFSTGGAEHALGKYLKVLESRGPIRGRCNHRRKVPNYHDRRTGRWTCDQVNREDLRCDRDNDVHALLSSCP